ncbi:MAG: hypothetical protein WCT04_18045 [Planctomycetota bacterium]
MSDKEKEEELDWLLFRYCEGTLDEESAARLNERIQQDFDAATRLLEYGLDRVELTQLSGAASRTRRRMSVPRLVPARYAWQSPWAWAAAMVVVSVGLGIALFSSNGFTTAKKSEPDKGNVPPEQTYVVDVPTREKAVSPTVTAPELTEPPAKPALLILNPAMTEVDAQNRPANWTQTWTGSGKIKLSRDTSLFKSAPASLALESSGGDARGRTMQAHLAKPGQRFRLSGFLKASGAATATVGVQFYTEAWKPIDFKAVGNALPGSDWLPFANDVVVPPGTYRIGIVLQLDGDGKVWLDDVNAKDL